MSKTTWRDRAGTLFTCQKASANGRNGMVVTNHPLGTAGRKNAGQCPSRKRHRPIISTD